MWGLVSEHVQVKGHTMQPWINIVWPFILWESFIPIISFTLLLPYFGKFNDELKFIFKKSSQVGQMWQFLKIIHSIHRLKEHDRFSKYYQPQGIHIWLHNIVTNLLGVNSVKFFVFNNSEITTGHGVHLPSMEPQIASPCHKRQQKPKITLQPMWRKRDRDIPKHLCRATQTLVFAQEAEDN